MTQGHVSRQFGSTEHLASEAIAAYVDGELGMSAYLRAANHLSICPDCAFEVDAQQQARRALRGGGDVAMPSSLLGLLSQIPTCNQSDTADKSPLGGSAFEQPFTSPYSITGRLWSRRRRR
ncbi:RNA polymerase subunit sigma-70 [Rhodococcus sp. WMMA185]|uniref:anti-sigma factor family protein n=1 Tax=Rhodococcus sp. WMMA185 TaxID=679318 RepID=UPI000878CE8F|nr:zf-HC2 domain-containing protein [Rhodococcus sp. WMMA185]AOW91981.1 RNA polymerase subunit sigma-70 [Rhodococcus sp. WMMA185]